jgi:hypothetical protein
METRLQLNRTGRCKDEQSYTIIRALVSACLQTSAMVGKTVPQAQMQSRNRPRVHGAATSKFGSVTRKSVIMERHTAS